MPQQGTSTPTGASAADPAQEPRQAPAEAPEAQEIGRGIEANIPGGKEAQEGNNPLHARTPGRPEGVVSNPDHGAPK
jgi:hypothetical protein